MRLPKLLSTLPVRSRRLPSPKARNHPLRQMCKTILLLSRISYKPKRQRPQVQARHLHPMVQTPNPRHHLTQNVILRRRSMRLSTTVQNLQIAMPAITGRLQILHFRHFRKWRRSRPGLDFLTNFTRIRLCSPRHQLAIQHLTHNISITKLQVPSAVRGFKMLPTVLRHPHAQCCLRYLVCRWPSSQDLIPAHRICIMVRL